MIFVSMVIEAVPSERDRLVAAMAAMMEETRREEGCVVYTYAQDLADPNRFHLCEMWESLPPMERHIDAPHSARFVATLGETARITAVKAFGGEVEKVRIRAPGSRDG
jgi:quinol monooxygenase YgiN